MRLPPPALALIAISALIILHFSMPFLSVVFWGQGFIGSVLFAAGVAIAIYAARGFFAAGTTISPYETERTSDLVTDGIYRYTRNPMYLGMATTILGVGFLTGTLATPFVLAGFIYYMNITQIAREEAGLEKSFGQLYLDYKARVNRWI